MRACLDDNGLSLRQFAASADVHYSVTTLHRYFSGQAQPPRQLIEVISQRCGGDLDALYVRASTGGATEVAEPEPPSSVPTKREGSRRWMIVAAVTAMLSTGVVVGLTTLRDDDEPGADSADTNLVLNGTFDDLGNRSDGKDPFTNWWVHEAQAKPQGGLAQIAVSGGTEHAWDIMLGQSGITLTKGKQYSLRFTAWTDKAVRVAVRVQSEEPPNAQALHRHLALNPTQKQFDYPFEAAHTMGSKGQIVFQLGGNDDDFTIYLDNVSLLERAN
jgi:hypothetical protein